MPNFLSRRRLLIAAAGFSVAAAPVRAQPLAARRQISPSAPASIQVNAPPIPFFDRLDHSHVRFGSLEYRSGLVLTSKFSGFGGLFAISPYKASAEPKQNRYGAAGSSPRLDPASESI
jgi:hypothetical protein